jgi:hypothetical protein
LEEAWRPQGVSVPVHTMLADLARWSPRFVDDSRARRYWIGRLLPLFADPATFAAMLGSPAEWDAAREIASAALYAAELEGNPHAQATFLQAIHHLAPLTSPQRAWTTARLESR